MRERPHQFIPGDYLMQCDECGVVFRRSELRERWDHCWVCDNDFECRHPQEDVRGKADKIAVPVARPEGTDQYITTPITQDDL